MKIACPACGQPMEIEADGVFRTHACPTLQDLMHEGLARLRYPTPPPVNFGLGSLPPELRARVEPLLERMSTGAIRPEDWEELGRLIGEHFEPDDGPG